MTHAQLIKLVQVAAGIILAGVAISLPEQYHALGELLLVLAGTLKGGALLRRPGDAKVE